MYKAIDIVHRFLLFSSLSSSYMNVLVHVICTPSITCAAT